MKIIESNQELVTSGYGWRTFESNGRTITDFHLGLDIVRLHDGYTDFDYICAKEKGVVCNIRKDCQGYEPDGSYGNFVHIDHGNGMSTVYAHLRDVYVEIGQPVEEGQRIGYMGATGDVTGGHVHFEVRQWNNQIDPTPYFNGQRMVELVDKNLPTPVERDINKNQFRINCDDTMNIRLDHTTGAESIGLGKTGYYDILQMVSQDGYQWYELEKDKWCALLEPYSEFVGIEQETPQNQEKEPDNTNTPKEPETNENKPKEEEIEPNESIFTKIIKFIVEILRKLLEKGDK